LRLVQATDAVWLKRSCLTNDRVPPHHRY